MTTLYFLRPASRYVDTLILNRCNPALFRIIIRQAYAYHAELRGPGIGLYRRAYKFSF